MRDSVLPTVIIGLGMTGIKTLNEIEIGVIQGYGIDALTSVVMLGLDFVDHQTSKHIRHLTVKSESSSTIPALNGWFDKRYYSTEHHQDTSERQIARATFLKYLIDQSPAILDRYIQEPLQHVLRARSGKTPVMTHLLVALTDDASALLLDIVNFVYRAFFQQGQETRLVIHLALPDQLFIDDSPSSETAKYYAALRELERFTISYGDTMHIVYPRESGLEDLNVPSSMLIFGVKLYRAGIDIPSFWADVLLPQIDGSNVGFAPLYLQTNVANWNAWRDAQIEQTGNRYGLYVGTYIARTAQFPVERLRRYWAARFAHETFDRWLGDGTPISLDQFWQVRHMPDGQPVSCPDVVRSLLNGIAARNLQTEADVRHMLFESERGNSYLNTLRDDSLDWQPTDKEFSSLPQLGKTVFQAVMRHVSEPYQSALTKIVDAQAQRFYESLNLFIVDLLHGPSGFRGTLPFLQNAIIRPLEQAAVTLRTAANAKNVQVQHEDWEESLLRAAQRVPTTRRWFNRESLETAEFFIRAQQMTEAYRTPKALNMLADLTDKLHIIAVNWFETLSQWQFLLTDTLLRQTKSVEENSPDWAETPYHMWFVDSIWADATYEKITTTYGATYKECLRWDIDGSLKLAYGNEVQILTPRLESATLYCQDWHAIAREIIDSLRLNLWDDYLLSNNRYREILSALQKFFSTDTTPWYRNAFIQSESLIAPITLPDLFINPLRRYLEQTQGLRESELLNEDATRIVRYSSAEVFPISQIQGVINAQSAYRKLNQQQRSRLHVLPAETEAVTWEARAYDQLNLNLNFSGSVVALFIDLSAVQRFVQLEALGLIQRTEYDKSGAGYALIIDDQFWWLVGTGNSSPHLTAITTFVFDSRPLPFGKPPSVGQRVLPQEELDSIANIILKERVKLRSEPYPDKPLNRVIEMLAKQPKLNEWARLQAEEAAALFEYHQKMLETRTQTKNRDEHDLAVVLALIAKVLYNDKLMTLRHRVH